MLFMWCHAQTITVCAVMCRYVAANANENRLCQSCFSKLQLECCAHECNFIRSSETRLPRITDHSRSVGTVINRWAAQSVSHLCLGERTQPSAKGCKIVIENAWIDYQTTFENLSTCCPVLIKRTLLLHPCRFTIVWKHCSSFLFNPWSNSGYSSCLFLLQGHLLARLYTNG